MKDLMYDFFCIIEFVLYNSKVIIKIIRKQSSCVGDQLASAGEGQKVCQTKHFTIATGWIDEL